MKDIIVGSDHAHILNNPTSLIPGDPSLAPGALNMDSQKIKRARIYLVIGFQSTRDKDIKPIYKRTLTFRTWLK
jgi:hypothetical protein